MPSRKKGKGKARKAAKEAKEEESRAVLVGAANQQQNGSIEAQMRRLEINNATLRKCQHGLVPLLASEEKIFKDFIKAYLATIRPGDNVGLTLLAAYSATKDKYADVYASKLESIISILSVSGTQRILEGDNKAAQLFAMLAAYFEDLTAMMRKTQAVPKATKVIELGCADAHTLVQYYRKRIPCSCLDEKYKEVKSVKKMGICYNLSCSLPGRKVERSKMFSCTRCGVVNYCSAECQKNDWKNHKQDCNLTAEVKAAFNSEQS